MAVFRIEKTRDYTVMSNYHLRDMSLSLKAKGLLSLMLSLPENWDYTMKGLARICKDGMDAQGDALDDMRVEASGILQIQYERGNNGFVKRKYVTLTIEAENLPAARARFSRIEADTLNRFKVMGAGARVLDGKERLALLHGLLHPEGGQFAFEWDWLPASGLSVKDFIAPSSFEFGETRRFRMGEMYGAVSFLQILAPEIQDRILTDFMDVEGNLLVTMHIRGINQNEAIKMVKRKITDLDAMKI